MRMKIDGVKLSARKQSHEEMRPARCRLLLAVLVTGLTACGPSQAAPKGAEARISSKSTAAFAVAGLQPGMTAEAIRAGAVRAGYTLTNQSTGPDWALALKQAMNGPRFRFDTAYNGISEQTYSKGGERLSVSFIPMPKSSVAYSIHYGAPPGIVSFASAKAELGKRFGRSSFGNTSANPWAQWCDRPAPSARACLAHRFLSLEEGPNGVSIHVEDPDLKAEQKGLLQQAGPRKGSF